MCPATLRCRRSVLHTERATNQLPNRSGTNARLYHSVGDYTSVFVFVFYSVCHLFDFPSQQHGLLHGERLLCVPVMWSSEQLGELLPYDRLLILELCPVVDHGVRGGGEGEFLNG